MIHTNRIVTVGEQECIIDRPIVLYRGDREVEIEFTLVGNEFTFSEEGNVIKSVNASHGQLVLNTPSGEHMFSELAECHEGKVVFVVTKEMIDEFIEMGFYSFQIRLYDSAEMKSRVTIPPVMNGFDIRNPIAAEDETNVVDQGIVDYARIFKDQSNEELPTFTWDGEYVKTEWAHHDVITENKLNKIEDALYSINANVKESDVVMLNTLDQVKKDADAYVKEHMAEVEADVEEFERNLNTGVEQFKIDTNAAMTAHKNEVSEELEVVNSQLAENTKRISGFVNLLEFNAICDGQSDDTNAFQNAIDFCLSTLGTENEINTIKIPPGRYKITKTIVTHPQIKLIADGFVKIESYITDGSVFYLRYPEGKSNLGCDYRGNPISGGSNGILIKNMLYTGNDSTEGNVFGGVNTALELGTREEHDATFSDIRMVSRYNLDNILIYGFKTGMQINGISHFMGHYEYIRIKLCDTCVQVGEYQGQTLDTSIENFNFNSCLFERSNNVIKWIRNSVGLTFNNCSFDFIRDNLMIAKTSGQRRIVFNNGHIEKIKNYLFLGDHETTFKGINTIINFKGVEMHLKYGQLFKSGSKMLVNFDSGCAYLRDEYYTDSSVNNYIATGKKMGCKNTYYNDINYLVFENDGVPTTGVNYITNGDFSMTDVGSLISTDVDYIKGFSSQAQTGAFNGTYSITDFSDNLDSWDISKQLNFQISPSSNYGNFRLVTNKIPVKSFRVSPSILVKSNDFNKTSLTIKVKCFDGADILIDNYESMSSYNQKWGSLPSNEWCVFTPLTNTGTFLINEKTSYVTIEFYLQSSNINSYFNITNLMCEFN